MNKQNIITILIVMVIVLGGIWYLQSNQERTVIQPQDLNYYPDITQEDDETSEAADASNGNMVPDNSGEVGTDTDDTSISSETTTINVPQMVDNGEIEMVSYQVPYTQSVLNATLKKLFEQESNVNGYNGLSFESATLNPSGAATIELTGSWYPAGDLSGLYMRRLFNNAVFQFNTVNVYQVYINGEGFDWCIDSQADPSESNCDTTPRYWIESRDDHIQLESLLS